MFFSKKVYKNKLNYLKFFVALIFSFILFAPKDTFALTVFSTNVPTPTASISPPYNAVVYEMPSQLWIDGGSGYIRFNFSLTKITGSSTSNEIVPVNTTAINGLGNNFICDIGTLSSSNSTYTTQVYSAICPVSLYNGSGLQSIRIGFKTTTEPATNPSSYQLSVNGNISFEVPQFIQVPDTSANDNANTNKIIAEQQKILQEQQKTNQAIDKNTEENKKTNDLIESDDTTESEKKAGSFFDDFNQNAHGLSGIVTAPLVMLQNLTSSKCSPLEFDLPIVHNHVVLPCMKSIYEEHFGIFFSLWQLITTGLISYNVILNMYKKVRDLQNPNNDKIEVLNL